MDDGAATADLRRFDTCFETLAVHIGKNYESVVLLQILQCFRRIGERRPVWNGSSEYVAFFWPWFYAPFVRHTSMHDAEQLSLLDFSSGPSMRGRRCFFRRALQIARFPLKRLAQRFSYSS
jgi:hypothetical protein